MKTDEFTLEDFIARIEGVKKLGPIGKLMKGVPGMKGKLAMSEQAISHEFERQLVQMRAIYRSMTRKERVRSEGIDENRRRRIARGAGVKPVDVARFLIQFDQMRMVMKAVGWGRRRGLDAAS